MREVLASAVILASTLAGCGTGQVRRPAGADDTASGPSGETGILSTADTSGCGAPEASFEVVAGSNAGAPVLLDASASRPGDDACGPLVFHWTLAGVPPDSTLDSTDIRPNDSADAYVAVFIPDVAGDYVVGLQVEDALGHSTTEHQVLDIEPPTKQRTVRCEAPPSSRVGEAVPLHASTTDGNERTGEFEWEWSVVAAPSCSDDNRDLLRPDGDTAILYPNCAGWYAVEVSVTDDGISSDPAVCSVDVVR